MKSLKTFIKDTSANAGAMDMVVGVAVGLIVLAAVFSLAPLIGHKIDSSIDIPAGSQWNSTDIPTGVEIWADNASLLGLVVLVIIIGLAIFYIRNMGGGAM